MTNDSRNPYAPPTAPVERPASLGAGGSLEDAVAGRYDFSIGEVMGEAWDLVRGFKAAFWGAAIVIIAIVVAVNLSLNAVVASLYGAPLPALARQVVSGFVGVLLSPLTVGLRVIAVRRASGLPNSFAMAFVGLARTPLILGAALLVTLVTYAGLALLVIPGIYLGLAYGMTLTLLMFHDMPVWTAMETSRRALTHAWFRIFGLYLLVGLLTGLSALPLGIPLIWTVPWALLVTGVLYRRIFGAPVATPSA